MKITEADLDAAELFRKEMKGYRNDYENFLKEKYSRSTANKHIYLISFLIDELDVKYTVNGFEKITLGMCGSKLVSTYNSTYSESLQLATCKNILFGFFNFIYSKYGIANQELLQKLKKK